MIPLRNPTEELRLGSVGLPHILQKTQTASHLSFSHSKVFLSNEVKQDPSRQESLNTRHGVIESIKYYKA